MNNAHGGASGRFKQHHETAMIYAFMIDLATPKNIDGKRGAYEEALVGIKVKDTAKPLEVLKVLHSFDPCLACAVHIIDANGKELSRYKMKTN